MALFVNFKLESIQILPLLSDLAVDYSSKIAAKKALESRGNLLENYYRKYNTQRK